MGRVVLFVIKISLLLFATTNIDKTLVMKKIICLLTLNLFFITFTSSCAQKKAESDKNIQDVKVVTLPSTISQEKIMDTIKAHYRGKVIVMDFWATWCPPCMQAMKSIQPIKQQYAKDKKEVVFVYITGETSPKNTWENAIKSIKGYHYRLSNTQYKYLLNELGIMGIPTYIIFDKKGNLSYANIDTGGYPGDDIISAEIDKALR